MQKVPDKNNESVVAEALVNLSTTSKETTTVKPEVTVPLPLPQTATIPLTTSTFSITSPSITSVSNTTSVVLPGATTEKQTVTETIQMPPMTSNQIYTSSRRLQLLSKKIICTKTKFIFS
jgi:hypothetical protein